MNYLIIATVVLLSHIIEGITGFGCMIIALPFLSAILGLKAAIPILVLLSTVFDIILLFGNTKYINWKVALKIIIITIIFMPVGFYALNELPEDILMKFLGIFVIFVAINGIVKSYINKNTPIKANDENWRIFCLPIAGLIQGAFGGSGPFMVIYSQSILKDKTTFRSTMAIIWITLNIFNIIQYGFSSMLTIQVWKITAFLCPIIIIGYFIGIFLHKKISPDNFSKLIYFILFITGISMFF